MTTSENVRTALNSKGYLDHGVKEQTNQATDNGVLPEYQAWVSKLTDNGISRELRDKIDPVSSQAQNIIPAVSAAALGLENCSDVGEMIDAVDNENEDDDIDEEELDFLDQSTRNLPFTPSDVGLFTTDKTYSLSKEQAWLGVLNHESIYNRLSTLATEAYEQVVSLKEAGVIDSNTVGRIKDTIPNALSGFNTNQFTKKASKLNYSLAVEDINNQQALIGGVAALGGLFLIYKALSVSSNILSNNPAAANSIRKNVNEAMTRSTRLREDTRNVDELLSALGDNEERLLKVVKEANGQQIISSLKGSKDGLQAIVDAKWSKGNEFHNFCNGFMQMVVKDDLHEAEMFGRSLTKLTTDMTTASDKLLNTISVLVSKDEGQAVNFEEVSREVNNNLAFIDEFMSRNKIEITTNEADNVDKVKITAEWFERNLTTIDDWYPEHAPNMEIFQAIGTEAFEAFNQGYAKNIDAGREELKKILSNEDANKKDKDNKNQTFKIATQAYLALTALLKAVVKLRNWIGLVIVKQNGFLANLLSLR